MKHGSMNNGLNIENNIDPIKVVGLKSRCIAWFKLADLISRKEKEKALNLYKLISYSFDDKAYALQVEGDILWSLEDKGALERYTQAAYLYKKEKKILASAAVYEHLLTLEPENIDYLKSLIFLYIFASWPDMFEKNYSKFLYFIKKDLAESEVFFDFSKKIIDFYINTKKMEAEKFKEEYEVELEIASNFNWLFSSIANVLKDSKKHLDSVKKYCLDNDLNFNS
jgi:hypothetical protein